MISPEQRKPLSEWICSFGTSLFGQHQLFDGNNNSTTAEWIRSFATIIGQQQLLFGDNNSTTTALPADNYIIPALRIASSLADQICKAHEAGQSPTPSSDWMDSIVVHSQPNNSEDGRFEGKAAEDEDRVGEGGNNNNIRVEILPSLLFNNTTDNDNSRQATDGILYSLGIVFYEIFSRGERPAELEQKHVGERSNGSQCQIGTEELCEDLDPLPFDQGGTIDQGGELSASDDLCLGACNLSENENNLSYDDIASQGQGPRKKRTQNGNHNICSVSVEPLKAKGVPRALCDLVANMVDCANGSISSDDTYQNMFEVRDDLQLMLDKPLIYLHDQDMGSLSTTGLQFGGTVFGRNAELSTIIDAYRRSVSGERESELVTLSGQSGTGKSLLGLEFGKYVVSNGGIFLFGKFDQLQQGKPLSALAAAFDQYCGALVQSCELRQKLAHQVNSVLGRDAYYLAKLIPNLAKILGPEMMNRINHDEDCINGRKRLQYLLCRFVEVISSTFAAPVALFLDDLQWADSASIAAMNQLLLTGGPATQNTRFFFLGCYREGESSCSPFWKAMCNSNLLNGRSTNIKLDCMGEDTVNTMVSETLRLSPRLTRSLSSIIYHKTKGNPLFVSRLMLSLSKEGLLRPSLSRRRWEWDDEKILCQKLPDDVAAFLVHSIGKLPEDVKSSLCVLSCFGASLSSAFIETLERALDRNLVASLDVAVAEGLLDKKDDRYRFSHDRIQEAAYNMMNLLDRCEYHFTYGMALAPLAAGEERDGILRLFTAATGDSILLISATQLNLAGPEAVQDESQSAIVANLNLRAGKKAMEMSDFEAAYSYFDSGISFLRKNHWKEHYTLSLELFDFAAKCALTNGDIVSLQLLSQQVLRMAQSFEDTLNVRYYTMCALASSSKLPESIEMGLDILSKLGIEVRGHESRGMEACVQETKDFLSAYTDDEILNTRRMTDPTMIMALKFLNRLETGMTQIMPKSVPYVTQLIIQLSLDHGMSPVSPIGFVHFGSYVAKLGDIRGGYHYVKLALALLDKVGSRESAGEVICFGTQVRAYLEPLQAALEYHNEGYAASMASGDTFLAAVNKHILCSNLLFAGENLQVMRAKCAELIKFLEERKQIIWMVQTQQHQRTALKLIGTDEEPKYVSSEEQIILATNNSVRTAYYFQRAFISFMFRSYDDTKENIEKYLACISNTWANLFLAHAYHAFYVGLISFWLARKSRDEQQWHERGEKSKLELKQWAESSRWTFENKWYLLEAEESFCNNDFEAAKTFYDKAVSSAKNHKFVHEEALANELAAYFYLELGEIDKSVDYFMLAHERYKEWGAFGKCDSLSKFVVL